MVAVSRNRTKQYYPTLREKYSVNRKIGSLVFGFSSIPPDGFDLRSKISQSLLVHAEVALSNARGRLNNSFVSTYFDIKIVNEGFSTVEEFGKVADTTFELVPSL